MLAGSETVAGTVAPSLASLTTRPLFTRRSQLPQTTTALPFGYKPRFAQRSTNVMPTLPTFGRSLGGANANDPERHAAPLYERDYTVFGILSNRSVVVRVEPTPEMAASTEEDGLIVYGILANSTWVRRYANGTIGLVHNAPHATVTDIDANSLVNPISELYRRPSITEAFLSTVSTWAVTPTSPAMDESHSQNRTERPVVVVSTSVSSSVSATNSTPAAVDLSTGNDKMVYCLPHARVHLSLQ